MYDPGDAARQSNLRGGDTVNQSFQITQGSQTITFTQPADHTYGDAAFTLMATANSSLAVSLVSNNTLVCTISSSQVTMIAEGRARLPRVSRAPRTMPQRLPLPGHFW